MVIVAPPPKYQRRRDQPRPPRASPAPSPARSRSRSGTPGGPPRCKHCNAATLAHEEGGLVCQTCGIINEEDSNFRAEIEFDESSSGAVKTRGTHVGANQTHSRTYVNRVGQAAGHVGQEATKASERARSDALHKMQHFASFLRIRDVEVDRAMYIFEQSYNRQFYRGRTLESVAIVCLYLAIRQCTTRERYALMLIDFAELSQGYYNVFELGKMAKALQSMLYLDPGRERWWTLETAKQNANGAVLDKINNDQRHIYEPGNALSLQDPEDLIERFCEKLDFGDQTFVVKRDAAKIAQSMNRDWMSTGRRPAGIAGAAVIIAARMNNYRRTLREVVLVAKVTEITLSKRIEEFKETRSSKMSVKDFRGTKSGDESEAQFPPSYYQRLPEWQEKQAQKKSKKRKRKAGALQESTAAIENNIDDQIETETEGESELETDEQPQQQPPTKQPRLDADGFVVPDLPVRMTEQTPPESPPKRKPGKPKGSKNWRPPPPTPEEEQEELDLEQDIQEQLRINASLDPTGSIARESVEPEVPIEKSDVRPPPPTPPDRTAPLGPSVSSNVGNIGHVSMNESLANDEFEDDPDVANCLLNEAERAFKETVWVEENKDWLRTEHAKKIKRELKDRELREKGIDPEKERMKKLRRKDGMQRAGRTGDVSYLDESRRNRAANANITANGEHEAVGDGSLRAQDGENGELTDAQRRSVSLEAQNSVQVMMQQRGTFSRRVDYNKLSQAYVLPGFEDSSESRSESPASHTSFYRPVAAKSHSSSRRRALVTAERIAGTNETDAETDNDQGSPQRTTPAGSSVTRRGQDDNAPGQEEEDEDAEFEHDDGTPEVATTQERQKSAVPAPTDGTESPLSSTHTPAGYGSGPATPQQSTQRQAPPAEDDDSEGDEDDYVDDDDEDVAGDEDLDSYFAAGEAMGEEEVVEEL